MNSHQQILKETQNIHLAGEPIPIKIHFPKDYYTIDYQIFMDHETLHFIRKDKTYIICPESKMEAKYNLLNPNEPFLQMIVIFHNDQEMQLLIEEKSYLEKIYRYLKNIISHKGFNDYFRPLKRLGRGSFAAVYLVEHKITKQQFAAKVFTRQGQKLQQSGRQALQNQIRTLKLLSHPNIIRFEGIYETQNLIYLITEYLSGGTLQYFTRKKMNLMGDFITKILSDTLQALSYLKKRNIMHRDIKPQNIILRETDNKWVLVDFGLAAFTNQTYLYNKCGTMGYIAPEIIENNIPSNPYTSACDLYSLGVIAYQLILGGLPFKVQQENIFDCKLIWNAFTKQQCTELHPDLLTLLKGLLEQNPTIRLTPEQASLSPFFTNSDIVQNWKIFNNKRIEDRYNKILQVKNHNKIN